MKREKCIVGREMSYYYERLDGQFFESNICEFEQYK